MSYEVKKINNDLGVVCNKIVADDMRCFVKLDIVYKGDIYSSRDISKALEKDKLEKHICEIMKQYEFTVENEDIEKIVKEVTITLDKEECISINEKMSFNVALDKLFIAAKKNRVDLLTTMCVDSNYFYIKATNKTYLQSALDDYECGWKALDFKRQLKAYGLLEISSGRPFEFTMYTLGNCSVNDNKGMNYLKVDISKMNKFFESLNKLKEVA